MLCFVYIILVNELPALFYLTVHQNQVYKSQPKKCNKHLLAM